MFARTPVCRDPTPARPTVVFIHNPRSSLCNHTLDTSSALMHSCSSLWPKSTQSKHCSRRDFSGAGLIGAPHTSIVCCVGSKDICCSTCIRPLCSKTYIPPSSLFVRAHPASFCACARRLCAACMRFVRLGMNPCHTVQRKRKSDGAGGCNGYKRKHNTVSSVYWSFVC